MKKYTFTLLLFALIISCKSSKELVDVPAPSIIDFTNTINAEGIKADLSVLAHDSLEGRDTGTEGLRKAARYLSTRYKGLGLTPVGDNGTYFQHFDLSQPITESYVYKTYTSDGALINESTHNNSEIGAYSTLLGGEQELSGGIVFAGYGISDESTGVDHFPENAEGKWLLLFYDRSITNFSALQSHIGEGKAIGAILIMSTDVTSFTDQANRLMGEFGAPGSMSLAYLQDNDTFSSAINRVNPELAVSLLSLNDLDALSALEESIKTDPSTFTPSEIPITIHHIPTIKPNMVQSKNLAAFIEGSDSLLKNEVVVVSSHYDHVGIGTPDSTGDALYNGADDDGSGTAGILHVAQALVAAKKAGVGTKRSVLILNVAGEEKGLLGSRYYSDHPIFDIENTVANINVDMIGRRDNEHLDDPDYIYVIGGKIISSGIQSMMEEANASTVNITLSDRYNDLDDPNQFYRRSDHWNFGRLGVPFIFFFNGIHADYHRPSDSVDKIDFEALTKRAQLVFMTTVNIANAEERPTVDNQIFIEKTKQTPR